MAMIETKLAKELAKRAKASTRVEGDRLLFERNGAVIGSTLIDGFRTLRVSRHAVEAILKPEGKPVKLTQVSGHTFEPADAAQHALGNAGHDVPDYCGNCGQPFMAHRNGRCSN